CLRRFFHARAMAVQEYHYHDREVMAAALPKAAYGTLTGIAISFPSFRVMACQSVGSIPIEMYSIAFI
ncbi:MAG TPA: hypothetical protein DC053_08115, partial [Lachnoclostridium sp.]|nr:hypothetical protein [Lachnoclostridium sp.]